MRTENHKHKVLEYMRQHGSITPDGSSQGNLVVTG